MSVRTTSVNSSGETGLIKYFATPALSALVFQSPIVMLVSTTMGMPDVARSCLRIRVASTTFISGRYKSIIMRFGRSAKALLIPSAKLPAREISYPASFRQKPRSSDKSGLSSTISIFCAIDRLFHRATLLPRLFSRGLRASAITVALLKFRRSAPRHGVTQGMELNQLLTICQIGATDCQAVREVRC